MDDSWEIPEDSFKTYGSADLHGHDVMSAKMWTRNALESTVAMRWTWTTTDVSLKPNNSHYG